MSIILIMTLTIGCMLLVVYHHLLYPLLLKRLAKHMPVQPDKTNKRSYKRRKEDGHLPKVTVLVPACNEENWIADKIRNLASLDYPKSKLDVIVVCDGCTDSTADVAKATIQEAICADVQFKIIEHRINQGKLSILNQMIPNLDCDLVALTDVSALISLDALLIASEHFQNQKTGVVNSKYCMTSGSDSGEATYWQYQNRINLGESCLGATLGAHGAFYIIRQELFQPLRPDTINDDFVLPMEIVKQGYNIVYETDLIAVEQETTNLKDDFKRRVRISAGNMQQTLRLFSLFNPRRPAIAFAFFSGKGLRLLTPYLVMIELCGCIYLREYTFFQTALLTQLLLIMLAGIVTLFRSRFKNKISDALRCLLSGHAANLIGGLRYLSGSTDGRWKKVNQ
ncbi:glycosyltransferase family 2 protein [Vibrio sp. HN007]|uniref:glycosyltransferase family 2 protein n=1 Tax=Vibrio iocasae TaxID=3098914 RepID=UPI0035D52663